jgi:hypothetical protein
MKSFLLRFLTWRWRRKKPRPRTVVAGVLVITLLVVLVNWLEYCIPTRRLRRINTKSLEHFSEFGKIGYAKPSYHDDMMPGDAWDLYEKAAACVESMDDEDRRFIVKEFMKKTSHDSTRARRIIASNDTVLTYLRLGTRTQRCIVPLDYGDGLLLELPNFMAIRGVANLISCRARLSVRSNPGAATDDVIDGLIFGQDLAGGSLDLIGHMMGIVCVNYSMNEIHDFLKHFFLAQPELVRLAYFLNVLADTWPALTPDIDADLRMNEIYHGKPWFLRKRALEDPEEKEKVIPFYKLWLDRHNSFEVDKYARRDAVGAAGFRKEMVEEIGKAEPQGWRATDSTVVFWMDKVDDSRNFILSISVRNIPRMFERRFEGITRARLAGAAALLELCFLAHGDWPDSLGSVKADDLEDLLIDPFTDRPLKYTVYTGRDSVCIYSVGPNMVDDDGVRDETQDDLLLVLHRPAHSQ